MTITAEFENEQLAADAMGDAVRAVVAEANSLTDDIHAALDHVRDQFKAMGFWTYRGGYHLALHLPAAGGNPQDERAVLIS
jgi:hypothetical protein